MSLLFITRQKFSSRNVGTTKRDAEEALEDIEFNAALQEFNDALALFNSELNKLQEGDKMWGNVFSKMKIRNINKIFTSFENIQTYTMRELEAKKQDRVNKYLAETLLGSIDFCLMLLHISTKYAIFKSKKHEILKSMLEKLIDSEHSDQLKKTICDRKQDGTVLSMPYDLYRHIKCSDDIIPYNVVLWGLSNGGQFDRNADAEEFDRNADAEGLKMKYAYQVCDNCPITSETNEIIEMFKELKSTFMNKDISHEDRALALLNAVLLISVMSLEEKDLIELEKILPRNESIGKSIGEMKNYLVNNHRKELFDNLRTQLVKIAEDIDTNSYYPDTNCQHVILPLLNLFLYAEEEDPEGATDYSHRYTGSCLDTALWETFYSYRKGHSGYISIHVDHFNYTEHSGPEADTQVEDGEFICTESDEMVLLWLAFGAIPRFFLPQIDGVLMNTFKDDPILIVNRRKRVCPIIFSVMEDMETEENKNKFFKTLITRNSPL